MSLPPPGDLINNPSFPSWFPGQEEITLQVLDWFRGPKRFGLANIPTGFGKTAISLCVGYLSGQKCVYLTYTKGLERQILVQASQLGMKLVEGQNSYECNLEPPQRVDRAICHAGVYCATPCSYYGDLGEFRKSRLGVTNYHYWIAQNEYGDGMLPPAYTSEGRKYTDKNYPLVVMDEGHSAGGALEQHLTILLTPEAREDAALDVDESSEWGLWQGEAGFAARGLDTLVKSLQIDIKAGRKEHLREFHRKRILQRNMETLATSPVEWIREEDGSGAITLCPLWPRDYKHRLLLGKKILIMSATLTRKAMEKLGVEEADAEWIEAPYLIDGEYKSSPFPPENSPIYHIDTIRLSHDTPPENYGIWARRIDQIIEGRMRKKGIVATVSYDRARTLLRLSDHRDVMISHDPGAAALQKAVDRFRAAKAPAVLVSPSVGSGWDFPGVECEYVIIGKVPFVPTRGNLMKARVKDDPEWANFLAMEQVIQIAGRGQRLPSDKCEVFIVDDMWRDWFWRKNKHLASKWFQDRVRGSLDYVPEA